MIYCDQWASLLIPTDLEHFLTLENYSIQARKWQEDLRYYYVVPYGPYYIWGATARILFGFAEGFKNANR